jgi:hypothetical protein
MLEHYYDINRKDEFDILFKDTYIGKHPTNLKNSIPVLKFNFSGIPTSGSLEEIEHSFDINIKGIIEYFLNRYKTQFNISDSVCNYILIENKASDILNRFIQKMLEFNIAYYLFIDEYDNFANNILIEHGKDTYKSITHAGGFLRSFFAVIKNGTESRVIERLFVTGVSPLVLSDVTSGFNIGDNISTDTLFNSMIGFSQEEVEELIDYYIKESAIKKDDRNEILEAMRLYYNNYTFSEATEEKLYNSDMVLYYVNKYLKSGKLPTDYLMRMFVPIMASYGI